MTLLVVLMLVSGSSTAFAAQYPGHGDTGWVHVGKRDCCNDTIAPAQNENALACENVGGVPAPMRGGAQRRGSCAWESARDEDGVTIFRCQSEASVWCR